MVGFDPGHRRGRFARRLYDFEFAAVNTRVLLFLDTGDKAVFSPNPAQLSSGLSDAQKRAEFDALCSSPLGLGDLVGRGQPDA